MDKEKTSSQNINVDKNNNPFEEIVTIVENSKDRAYRKVNEELILMYQEVGKYISKKTEEASYGSWFVDNVAESFSTNYPELKGFNRIGLYRMKQFYELYKDDEKVSPPVTQLSWANHLKIMSASKSQEERRFYHRGLSCLVAFELKIGEFKPEYIGKMNLYLEVLDGEVKKQMENNNF